MSNRKIEMYEYRQIIVQMRLGYKDREIARTGLAGRKKCRNIRVVSESKGWLGSNSKIPSDAELDEAFNQRNKEQTKSSVVNHHEDIKKLSEGGVSATTIYRYLVNKHSFRGSYTAVQTYIFKHFKEKQSYTMPLSFLPGETAQIDFGQGPMIYNPDSKKMQKSWFFIVVLSYSRHMYAEIVRHQDVPTWIGCHIRAFKFFNGMPRKLIIDNAKCAIITASKTDPVAQHSYYDFASEMGFCISACAPRDPKKKGRVEAGVKYIKGSFFPLREFKDIVDANAQLQAWVLGEAGNRIHGSTGKVPLTEFTDIEEQSLSYFNSP